MNPGGDAAEQVVRMSLEGVEVAARITGYRCKEYRGAAGCGPQRGAKDKGQGSFDEHAEDRQRA
jgi:hypothetical protein